MSDCCGNCRFFVRDPSNLKQGQCRVHAPVAMVLPAGANQIGVNGFFPPVNETIWCGEHKPRLN